MVYLQAPFNCFPQICPSTPFKAQKYTRNWNTLPTVMILGRSVLLKARQLIYSKNEDILKMLKHFILYKRGQRESLFIHSAESEYVSMRGQKACFTALRLQYWSTEESEAMEIDSGVLMLINLSSASNIHFNNFESSSPEENIRQNNFGHIATTFKWPPTIRNIERRRSRNEMQSWFY